MDIKHCIAFDGDGSPYIAHAFGDSGGYGQQRGSHKYIMKTVVNGKPRYFYTQAEVNAYYANKQPSKDKISKINQIAERNGITITKRSSAAKSSSGPSARSTSSRITSQYNQSLFGDPKARAAVKAAEKDLKEANNISVPSRKGDVAEIRDPDAFKKDEALRRDKEKKVAAAENKLQRAKNDLKDSMTIDDRFKKIASAGENFVRDRLWKR